MARRNALEKLRPECRFLTSRTNCTSADVEKQHGVPRSGSRIAREMLGREHLCATVKWSSRLFDGGERVVHGSYNAADRLLAAYSDPVLEARSPTDGAISPS